MRMQNLLLPQLAREAVHAAIPREKKFGAKELRFDTPVQQVISSLAESTIDD